MSSHNELNKRLQDSDPQVRYTVMFLYEQMAEIQKQLDQVAQAMLGFAQMMEQFVAINNETNAVLQNMRRGHDSVDGVSVYSESVLDEPEE
jgi:hypothetical protein